MIKGLQEYKLGEILDVTRGTTLSSEYYADNGELIRLTLGHFDYVNGGFKQNTSKGNLYFTGPVRDEFILSEGDIITPLTEQTFGLIGSTAIIPESGKYIQSQDVGLVKCKEDRLLPEFCFYLLPTDMVKNQLSAGAQQTSIRHTSPDKIKACIVFIPDTDAQRRIAGLLSAIDHKIAVNRAINQNLEALAKLLYDYWFVQFDFPNEEGKPYKSSGGVMKYDNMSKREIPFNCKRFIAKDLCPIITGKEDANFSEEKGEYPFFTCSKDTLKCGTSAYNGSAILIAGNGDFNVKHYSGKFNAYQRTYVLIPREIKYYACLYFASLGRINMFKDNSNGSIIKFITKGDVENIEVFECGNEKIYQTLNTLLFSIEHNNRHIETLLSQRDKLLPLLMNGQVSVKHLNSDLSAR